MKKRYLVPLLMLACWVWSYILLGLPGVLILFFTSPVIWPFWGDTLSAMGAEAWALVLLICALWPLGIPPAALLDHVLAARIKVRGRVLAALAVLYLWSAADVLLVLLYIL